MTYASGFLTALLLTTGCFFTACQPKTAPSATAKDWKLVWSDEFNYKGSPDTTKWNYDTGGHGFGNNELQYYTPPRPENARVENGHLIIEARKETWEDKAYTSAKLITKGKGDWTYGKITVKARLPKGTGTWPAIWMLASTPDLQWPDDGEIDIMEHVGHDEGKVHASVHTKKYNHVIRTQKTATTQVMDATTAFHEYTIEWTPEQITAFVDDKLYFTFNNDHSGKDAWPYDSPFYLILNIAVGGNWGGQKGVDDSIFPQTMEVDYVRIYQK